MDHVARDIEARWRVGLALDRRWALPWALIGGVLAACGDGLSPSYVLKDGETDTPVVDESDTPPADVPLPWSDDPCAGIRKEEAAFSAEVARFVAQDDAAPPAAGQLVVAGSSSVRRWEGALEALAPWGAVQRGIGGARMLDVAAWADELLLRHQPRGVLLFAGTNDIAVGTPPEEVVRAYRCVVERVHEAVGPVPVLYIGITPTPSRWSIWAQQDAVNQEVARLAGLHPALRYVDVPAAFLERGGPPDASLFVSDGLHLSEAGYALWTRVVVPAVEAVLPRRPAPVGGGPPAGAYVRVDLGPSNPEDGQPAPAVDAFGIHWNAWHPTQSGGQILAGEALRGLRTTAGAASGVDLVITGGFRSNGLRNGGLVSPPGDLLGTLAVPEATSDFFYIEDPDDPGGIALTGLDPARRYTLRLFASRATDEERRVTRYVVRGAATTQGDLLTTGPDIGRAGYDGNDSVVLVLAELQPDAWGGLYVDVQKLEGRFAYLSLLELEAR